MGRGEMTGDSLPSFVFIETWLTDWLDATGETLGNGFCVLGAKMVEEPLRVRLQRGLASYALLERIWELRLYFWRKYERTIYMLLAVLLKIRLFGEHQEAEVVCSERK